MSSAKGSPVLGPGARRMLDRFLSDPDFRERVCHDPDTEAEGFELTLEERGSLQRAHQRLDGLSDRHLHAFALAKLTGGDEAGILFW